MFDPTSKQVVTLGDRHARVFHNVAGYIAAVQASPINFFRGCGIHEIFYIQSFNFNWKYEETPVLNMYDFASLINTSEQLEA